ncbi:conserved protein of unknown function [Candidatus Promineifilum breve]|mgnify:FL=1|uniref:Uncharacterized protein n=2 Tax=Candidatus Promineifilum breve TaxID=1806508 RepID=A0A160T2T2_9CHLR|nr:conserved protein of unknown function [Candidatus Promineifilum breve]
MELDKQPKPDIRDYAHAIVKGTISSIPIPFVPGIAAEIFSILFTPSLLKRQDEWMSSIAQGLIQLQEKVEGFNLEDLSSNESFVTVTLQATQHALRNHQMEKLEALRNAVLNSALPNTLEDDIQLIFLGLVDTLTTWHLRILKLFDDPTMWAKENQRPFPKNWGMGGVSQVVNHAYPELERKGELFQQIVRDLSTYGLAQIPSGMMTVSGMLSSRTSNFGKQFLHFISTPKPLE